MSQPCKGCGRDLVWAKTPAGKNVPLELVPEVILRDGVAHETETKVLVNHFRTCPRSSEFSGKSRKEGG